MDSSKPCLDLGQTSRTIHDTSSSARINAPNGHLQLFSIRPVAKKVARELRARAVINLPARRNARATCCSAHTL